MTDEQQEQGDPDRDTLPPEPPHPCPQQEMRSAIGEAQDVIGVIAENLIKLGSVLLRIGQAANRIILKSPKDAP